MTDSQSEPQVIRETMWRKLRGVARPDSRFHFNFAEFIPDFEGSVAALQCLVDLSVYQDANFIFVTPDNCLTSLRERVLLDEKEMVVSTYGIYRGLVRMTREMVPLGEERYASWLDGLETYGTSISLKELARRERFDLLVTGASAVSSDGVRFGKGHGFFDVEWGIFYDIGIVDDSTPIVAVVHDVQIVDADLEPGKTDTIVDYIVTPSKVVDTKRTRRRPQGIYWNELDPEMYARIPLLQELRNTGQ